MKIGVVSLGCDKNRIDSENMLAYLAEDGFGLTSDPSDADAIVVNTCAFIDEAKQEAISTILEMAEYKKNKCKYLIVTGCLPQRYMNELKDGFPEVDAFLGTGSYHLLPRVIRDLDGKHTVCIPNDKDFRKHTKARVLTTPPHYAYLKIAEGCDNHCTYCAIPLIRGRYTSVPIADLVDEAKALLRGYPIKELVLVAQDLTRYGYDLEGRCMLVDLLKQLSELDVEWIRLLYLYPEGISDELLEYISENKKICKYLDIPCQHISDRILKKMNRRITKQGIISLFDKIRAKGGFCIRSTFIVGFPTETESDVDELEEFLKTARLDRCGFFRYSKEDNTAAARLDGQIDEETKQARYDRLYSLQESIMNENTARRVGGVETVLYEGIDEDAEAFYGRTQYDAPDVDARVYFGSSECLEVGNFYPVRMISSEGCDLIGETVI